MKVQNFLISKTPLRASLVLLGAMVGNGVQAQNIDPIIQSLNQSRLRPHGPVQKDGQKDGGSQFNPSTDRSPSLPGLVSDFVHPMPERLAADGFLPNPRLSTPTLAQSLDQQRLQKQGFTEASVNQLQQSLPLPMSDVRFYGGYVMPSPPSTDGIPLGHWFQNSGLENIQGIYTTREILAETLQLCRETAQDYGPLLTCYEQGVATILAVSGQRKDEEIARIILNRAVDTVHHVLPVAGKQRVEIARVLGNYYKSQFHRAAAFLNQSHLLNTRFEAELGILHSSDEPYDANGINDVVDPTPTLMYVSSAEAGRLQFADMYRMSTNLSLSESAQAIFLMRGLGYLGFDLTADPLSRDRFIRQLILGVMQAQESPVYNRILTSFANSEEPKISDKDALQNISNKLARDLKAKLPKAGVIGLDQGRGMMLDSDPRKTRQPTLKRDSGLPSTRK